MTRSTTEQRRGVLQRAVDTRYRRGRGDSLAILVLDRAIKILQSVVAKKRGEAVLEAVRREIQDEPDYLVARYLEITALESALQPRRRGRKPKPKPPTRGSRGRPMIWGPLATLCLKRLELGQAMLREKGEPVTNVRAYELALAKELPKLSLDDRKRLANNFT